MHDRRRLGSDAALGALRPELPFRPRRRARIASRCSSTASGVAARLDAGRADAGAGDRLRARPELPGQRRARTRRPTYRRAHRRACRRRRRSPARLPRARARSCSTRPPCAALEHESARSPIAAPPRRPARDARRRRGAGPAAARQPGSPVLGGTIDHRLRLGDVSLSTARARRGRHPLRAGRLRRRSTSTPSARRPTPSAGRATVFAALHAALRPGRHARELLRAGPRCAARSPPPGSRSSAAAGPARQARDARSRRVRRAPEPPARIAGRRRRSGRAPMPPGNPVRPAGSPIRAEGELIRPLAGTRSILRPPARSSAGRDGTARAPAAARDGIPSPPFRPDSG